MANLFLDIPLPALNGAGAAVDVSSQGGPKTITCVGSFPGATVTIEASSDGGLSFWPVVTFQGAGERTIPIACQYMRTNVSGRKSIVPFDCNVDVGAPENAIDVAAIPLPIANGSGAAVDVSEFGLFCTFICTGAFEGAAILVEISEDGNDWASLCQFSGKGGIFSQLLTASFVRATVSGRKSTLPFSGALAIAAYAEGGGGGGGAGDTVTLTNNEVASVPAGTPVYNDAAGGFKKAQADDIATGRTIGLLQQETAAGEDGRVQVGGPIELTTDEWDAICGTVGGLSFNTPYYLSAATEGELTPTPPSSAGEVVQQVIVGLSPTLAVIRITDPDELGSGTNLIQLTNNSGAPMIIGTPVYSDGPDSMAPGVADGTGKSTIVGLVADTVVGDGAEGDVAVGGLIVATTDEWDAVAGTVGGLTNNTVYYLDPANPGRLTSIAPVNPGEEVVQVIIALSTTKARIAIQPPVLL